MAAFQSFAVCLLLVLFSRARASESPHPEEQPEVHNVTDPYSQITFYLFTRFNPSVANQIYVGDLNGANFDPAKSTKFLVHGFAAQAFNSWPLDMKDAFLALEDCNVITVDWAGLAAAPDYVAARANARPTGEYLAEMYFFLEGLGLSFDSMHCVGKSLGCHVCGFSGKAVLNETLNLIGRISGMDPALPLFDIDRPENRLSIEDAALVDIMHTCGGVLGFEKPLGHIDFFPNGGVPVQPGCSPDITGNCSHSRAESFYIESIPLNNFRAVQCESWELYLTGACVDNPFTFMGYLFDFSLTGNFFLETASEAPFALG
ncbi:lipase member H-like [Neocloeon triangulifer]|uniref:lipase member H-like n=1 Tax=Neocloeon triangulifer TaxID=2078957 RepID=UPI00286EDDDB|nr:lipase member H-like [Neocloeon triangulifer]